VARSRELLIGRYLRSREETEYRPVGYQISAAQAREERASGRLTDSIRRRLADHDAIAHRRLASQTSGST